MVSVLASLQRKLFVEFLRLRLGRFRLSLSETGPGQCWVWTPRLHREVGICCWFFGLRLKRSAAQLGSEVELRHRRRRRQRLSLRKQEVERLEDRGEVDAAQTAVPVQLGRGNTCRTNRTGSSRLLHLLFDLSYDLKIRILTQDERELSRREQNLQAPVQER